MAGFEYYLIGSEHVREAFQTIKTRLETCRKKSGFKATTEDVYHELKSNRTNLVLFEFKSEVYGFALVHPQLELGTGEKELFVWYLSQDNIPGAFDFFARTMEEIGKQHGCVRTAFHTRRPGFHRGVYEKYGFKPVATVGVAEYGR